MRIMFMGTPDFAVTSLKALADNGHTIGGVVTQPDKPKGRGHKISHPPVYEYAEKCGFNIYQPETLRGGGLTEILNAEKPELIVVAAYGKILPEYVLEYPKYGCVNVHASLLPKYRGAAPIQRCIIDGEKVTGVTTMLMEKGLDTGDMLEKSAVEIDDDDNFETLHDKLAEAGGKLIVSTVRAIENGTLKCEKQNSDMATYAEMITKETAKINWNDDAENIRNLVRGLYPAPKAFSNFKDNQVKITLSKTAKCKADAECGTVVEVGGDYIRVKCFGETALDILNIQPAGKREMAVSDYLKGNAVAVGDVFGF